MQTSCKDVPGAPELCSDQPSSGKRSQIRGHTEEATGVIMEREFLAERGWHCSPQTHLRGIHLTRRQKAESVVQAVIQCQQHLIQVCNTVKGTQLPPPRRLSPLD